MWRLWRNQGGFSLVEILTLSGIASFVVLAIAALNMQLSKQQSDITSLVRLTAFRDNLEFLIKNNTSWARIKEMNPSMNCLRHGTACTGPGGQPLANQPFAVYDASPSTTPFFDATSDRNGLTYQAVLCRQFDRSHGDCPLRFDLKWSAECTSDCVNPSVRITGELLYNPDARKFIINPATYSLRPIVRAAN